MPLSFNQLWLKLILSNMAIALLTALFVAGTFFSQGLAVKMSFSLVIVIFIILSTIYAFPAALCAFLYRYIYLRPRAMLWFMLTVWVSYALVSYFVLLDRAQETLKETGQGFSGQSQLALMTLFFVYSVLVSALAYFLIRRKTRQVLKK